MAMQRKSKRNAKDEGGIVLPMTKGDRAPVGKRKNANPPGTPQSTIKPDPIEEEEIVNLLVILPSARQAAIVGGRSPHTVQRIARERMGEIMKRRAELGHAMLARIWQVTMATEDTITHFLTRLQSEEEWADKLSDTATALFTLSKVMGIHVERGRLLQDLPTKIKKDVSEEIADNEAKRIDSFLEEKGLT